MIRLTEDPGSPSTIWALAVDGVDWNRPGCQTGVHPHRQLGDTTGRSPLLNPVLEVGKNATAFET